MNWLGELVQQYVSDNDTVISLGCGILQEITGLQCKNFTGVDIYPPYVEKLKNKGINAICADVTKYNFNPGKFDIVLALDVLEHLNYRDAFKLIKKMKTISNKKVIVYTPSTFFDNIDVNWKGKKQNIFEWMENDKNSVWKGLGVNKYQEHKCFLPERRLNKLGFITSKNNPDKNIFGVWDKND